MISSFRVLSAVVLAISTLHRAAATECPVAPEQASKDSKVAVQVAVGRLGPIKAGELSTEVERTTRDLLGKLPSADKVYLEQMMFAAYCTTLRDDTTTARAEKARLLREYANEVRGSLGPAAVPIAGSVVSPPTGPGAVDQPVAQRTAPTQSRSNPSQFRACLAGTRNVIVASGYAEKSHALAKAVALRSSFPAIGFKVVSTVAGDGTSNAQYAVLAGHGLSRADAQVLVQRMRSLGIAKDAYHTLQHWDAPCDDESIAK